jgi:hypothetical protein
MRINSKVMATSIVALSLLAATPALADSGEHGESDVSVRTSGDAGLHLGSFLHFFAQGKEDKQQKDTDTDTDSHKETAQVFGSVAAKNGTTLTVTTAAQKTVAIDVSGATFVNAKGDTIALADIKVGDSVTARGTLLGTVLTASSVRDLGAHGAFTQKVGVLGTILSTNSGGFVVSPLGTSTNVNVEITSDTKFRGDASGSSDLTTGDGVLVIGSTASTTPGTVTASLVVLFQDGLSFFKHLFR